MRNLYNFKKKTTVIKNLKLCMLAVLLLTRFYVSAQEVFDSNFGESGISSLGYYTNPDVQFQGEDKIISLSSYMLEGTVHLNRLNLDGVLDETFGNSGVFENSGHTYGSENLVLDSEGNIYFASNEGSTKIKVTKVTPDGILDVSFGNSGHAEVLVTNVADGLYITKVAIDNNGKLIASGEYLNTTLNYERIIVARFNQDGSIDNTFGENGLFLNPEIPNEDYQRNSANPIITPDNSIIVSGYVYTNDDNIGILTIKIKPDGTLDDTFADAGVYNTFLVDYSSVRAGVVKDDNSIVLCGGGNNTSSDFSGMITKLSANGELDTSFGNNGYGECFNGGQDTIVTYYDAILVNDKILVTGDILDLDSWARSTVITKLNLDGTGDDSYGENGTMIISSPSDEKPSIRARAFTEKDDEFYFAGELSNEDSQVQGIIYKLINQSTIVNSISKTDFAIYPNPASDFVHISSENIIESVSIYNATGQKIFEKTNTRDNCKISTSQYKKGVYLLKAKVNGNFTTTKLIIE